MFERRKRSEKQWELWVVAGGRPVRPSDGRGGCLEEVAPEKPLEKLGAELCADEGYFSLGPIGELQACGVRTVIADPQAGRRKRERLALESRSALRRASAATRSISGQALLRKRGEHLERGFAHTLACGGQPCAAARS